MTLRWKQFEGRAKKIARAEIRASPKLKATRKKAGKARRTSNQMFLVGFMVTIFSFAPVIHWGTISRDAGFAALAVVVSGMTFLGASMWQSRLYNTGDLAAMILLPLRTDDIFRIQTRRAAWTVSGLLICFVVLYGVTFAKDLSPAVPNAMILAVCEMVLSFALVAHVVAYLPQRMNGLLAFGLTFGWSILSLALLASSPGPGAAMWVPLASFLPATWIHELFFALSGASTWTRMFFALPIAIVFALAPYSFARVRRLYTIAVDSSIRADSTEDDSRIESESGVTEIADRANAEGALAPPALVASGFIERFLFARFTERERLVVSFLWRHPTWTSQLRWSIGVLAVISIVAALLGKAHVGEMVFLVAFVFGQGSLPILTGGAGFSAWPCGGNLTAPQFAFAPISFDEMFGVTLKINLLRTLIATPIWVAFTAGMTHVLGNSPVAGAILAFKIMLILAALQPFLFAVWLASSITIKRKFWPLPFVVLCLGFIVAAVIFFFGFAVQFVTTVPSNAAGLTAFVIVSLLWNRYFRWLYRSSRVDTLGRKSK
jgi:hypothetical protein